MIGHINDILKWSFCYVDEKCGNGIGIYIGGKRKIIDFNQTQVYKLTREFLSFLHESTYEDMRGPKRLHNFTSLITKLVHFHESTHRKYERTREFAKFHELTHKTSSFLWAWSQSTQFWKFSS